MNIVGKKVAYITLGCKLNFSETSTIKHSLEQEGAVTVGEKDGADIFVINTCSVTDIAEKKGRQMIRKIIHRNPGAYIVVVGCYAQLRAREIMDIEGVHLVLNARDKFNVAHYLNHLEEQERHEPHSCDIFGVKNFDLAYSYGDRTRCFLKIQDGCDYFCSYCTIPFARGRSRSAAIQDVIKAARNVASKGIKEIILTGVNTGDFGRETGVFEPAGPPERNRERKHGFGHCTVSAGSPQGGGGLYPRPQGGAGACAGGRECVVPAAGDCKGGAAAICRTARAHAPQILLDGGGGREAVLSGMPQNRRIGSPDRKEGFFAGAQNDRDAARSGCFQGKRRQY